MADTTQPVLVAGVDCSTQSTKVVVCDAATGAVLRQGTAPHPDATEVDPQEWWQAFTAATVGGLLDGVQAMAVAGQQHGMVLLDEAGDVVRPALLWNDTRSAGAAGDLIGELGGPGAWAEAVGTVPVASLTVSKLRWVAEHEEKEAGRAAAVLLPHDWMTHRLAAGGDRREPTTDRGDASGTGYWSPASGQYRTDLLVKAFGRQIAVPRVAAPAEVVGRTPGGVLLAPGTGDNMGAALGLGAGPGDVIVSLGTSGVVSAVTGKPTGDPSGQVAGFADATGRFLPLVCTLNAARVLSSAATLLGVDFARLDELALSAPSGSGGLVLLPYLDGERTPDLPLATGLLYGLTRSSATPATLARAAVEGLLCGLADGLDAVRAQGVEPRRVQLIGGAARSAAIRALAPAILGVPVEVPDAAEYVAVGAARQAAWALASGAEAPDWEVAGEHVQADDSTVGDRGSGQAVRDAYGAVRDRANALLTER